MLVFFRVFWRTNFILSQKTKSFLFLTYVFSSLLNSVDCAYSWATFVLGFVGTWMTCSKFTWALWVVWVYNLLPWVIKILVLVQNLAWVGVALKFSVSPKSGMGQKFAWFKNLVWFKNLNYHGSYELELFLLSLTIKPDDNA